MRVRTKTRTRRLYCTRIPATLIRWFGRILWNGKAILCLSSMPCLLNLKTVVRLATILAILLVVKRVQTLWGKCECPRKFLVILPRSKIPLKSLCAKRCRFRLSMLVVKLKQASLLDPSNRWSRLTKIGYRCLLSTRAFRTMVRVRSPLSIRRLRINLDDLLAA